MARVKFNCKHDPSSNPVVDPDPKDLSVSRKEEAEWYSSEGRSFTLRFNGPNGSPFSRKEFHVPKGGSDYSAQITVVPTNPPTPYKYEIEDDLGKKLDPTIIVTN